MSTWNDLGLPNPEIVGYGYSVDAGLIRTPFATANPRQSRRYTKSARTFTAQVLVSQSQLKLATNFLEASGFTWFSIDLLSGHWQDGIVSSHCVRLSEDYSVSAVGADYYRVQMLLEQLVERSVIVTTWLYNITLVEPIFSGLVLPPSAKFQDKVGDTLQQNLVLPPSADLRTMTRLTALLEQALLQALVLPVSGNMLGSELVATPVEGTMHALQLPVNGNLDTALLADVSLEAIMAALQLPPSGNMTR